MIPSDNLPILSSNSKINQVMDLMNNFGSSFCILINDDSSIAGIVTDGDIRRALTTKFNATDSINMIMNQKPIFVTEGDNYELVQNKLSRKLNFIPVVSKDKKVVGAYLFEDMQLPSSIKDKTVCVLGLGYVGLTLSLVLADEGFKVFGFDKDSTLIDNLSNRVPSFFEDGIDSYLQKNINRNLFPTKFIEDVDADIYIITVGTPVDPITHAPNISYIEDAMKVLSQNIKHGDLIILRSTVPVGTTRGVVLPILDKYTKLRAGRDYFLSYAPERTIEGAALDEIKSLPQIVGSYDEHSQILTEMLFREITSTIVSVKDLESAEMVKIMNNTFRDVKFAYSNEMALICRDLGLDMVELVNAANMGYTRDRIPIPSPGVGGACLTKDSYILAYSVRDIESKSTLIQNARKVNELIPINLVNEISKMIKRIGKNLPKVKIFIVGFAFKGDPETSDMRSSTTIDLLNELLNIGVSRENIFGFDPVVDACDINALGIKFTSVIKGFKGADVIIFMNNHKSYKNLNILKLLESAKK